jgi:hypothetical protein
LHVSREPGVPVVRPCLTKKREELSLSLTKPTLKRIKSQDKNWEKMFANHISDKELAFKTYKELLKYIDKKTNKTKKGKR